MERTDAQMALAEIHRRRQRVVDRVLVPAWYWWLVGAGMIVVGLAADTRSAALVVPVALAYAAVVGGLALWMILGGRPGARVSRELMDGRAAVLIVAFVWVVVGLSLGVAFGLQAVGFRHPGLAGTLIGAVLVIAGGPVLMKRLRRLMVGGEA